MFEILVLKGNSTRHIGGLIASFCGTFRKVSQGRKGEGGNNELCFITVR